LFTHMCLCHQAV